MTDSLSDADVADRARRIVATMAPEAPQLDDLSGDQRLIEDLGFDSIRLMELTVALERGFGLPRYRPEQLADVRTVDDVVTLVNTGLAAR